jgi:hypothetical protein
MKARVFALALVASCCRQPPPAASVPVEEKVMDQDIAALATALVEDRYGETFTWPQHDAAIEAIWSEPGNPARLERLVDDTAAPGKARLVAAEVLFLNDYSFVDRHDRGTIAQIYADALVHRHVAMANPWGLLWYDDTVGEIGGRFAMLERPAIPVLRRLLDDATIVDWYAGSEEATVGNGQQYRIKDFAAFYLADMVHHPIPFHADPAARDREIAALLPFVDRYEAAEPAR